MILELINRLIGNFGYIILVSFVMIKTKVLHKSMTDEIKSTKEIVTASIMF